MSGGRAVPVRARRVASRLRDLRLRSGSTASEVARALGISPTKLSRMESAQRGLKSDDVAALLGFYRVPARERQDVLNLVRNAMSPNWWTIPHSSLEQTWADFTSFEAEATALRSYETMLVPGLLQSPGYVAAVAQVLPGRPDEVLLRRLLDQRVARQTLLHSSRRFEFLIEQTVLERLVGSAAVMHQQLQRVAAVAHRANVSVQVLPLSAGAHAGLDGPFLYLEFAEHADLVLGETVGCLSYVEEEPVVAERREVLRSLRESALSPVESIDLVQHLADDWHRRASE
ncbi:helix-turn-helix domain-containing protein [Saccharopolyspora sp. MS10]|uniref:helix-turn-helix domain-containing protein n=1 Tax=Saccharopolyspora sp. MS10 TaxID=3385973 RepID=UPI0039A26941